MKRFHTHRPILILPLLVAGCLSMTVSREIFGGRAALRTGHPKEAIPYFEEAAKIDPNYLTNFTLLNTGVWTYLGRAYFLSGENEKALAALEKGKAAHSDDYVARIFLGAVLSTQKGREAQAVSELEAGLNGLGQWLASLPGSAPQGQYWDPGHYIANKISQTSALVRAEQPDWQAIRDNVKWIGRNLEQEILDVQFQIQQERGDGDPFKN